MATVKRKQFSLEEKLRMLKAVDSGEKKKDVAERFGISASTLSTILKAKDKIQEKGNDSDINQKKKRFRPAVYEDVNLAVLKWFKDVRSKNIPVSGPLIRRKALDFATLLGQDRNFQASSGWLYRFCKTYGICSKTICGEENSAPRESAEEWRDKKLTALNAQYSPDDIFNADETGIFFQLLPHRTLTFAGSQCKGGKKSKQRLTALFCCNASGTEKLKPVIIGKSLKPRCFKNVKSLPCIYRANSKAWMTEKLFSEWLLDVDANMGRKKRKILLIMDNCSAHMKIPTTLKWITVEFLPPNCTSILQPLDLGIIQTVKTNYRKRLLQCLLLQLDRNEQMQVNIRQAIDMIMGAWWSVKPSTIQKCWKKMGVGVEDNPEVEVLDDNEQVRNVWETIRPVLDIPADVTLENYIAADNALLTSHELTDEDIVASITNRDQTNIGEDAHSDGTDDEEPEEPRMSVSEAFLCANKLKLFLTNCKDVPDQMFINLDTVADFIEKSAVNQKIQSKITNYFQKK